MKKLVLIILTLVLAVTAVACNPAGGQGATPGSEEWPESKYPNNYVDYVPTKINETGITWPQGQALPTFAPHAETVIAMDIRREDGSNHALYSAFAGLINRKQPRVMLYTSNEHREKWCEAIGINLEITKDAPSVILQFKEEIKGLIVWDSNVPDTINLATTLAGFEDALIVNEEQLAVYGAEPYNFPVITDLRGQFTDAYDVYSYIYEEVWPKCTKRLFVGIKADGWELRDITVGANLCAIWLDPTDATQEVLLKKYLADCTPGESYYIGWWTSEGDGIWTATSYGVATIPADYYYNYSLFSSTSRELTIPTVPAKPELENKYYIAFAISDGDNLQYDQHAMKTNGWLWPSKERGQIPISWTFTAAFLDAGPQILNYYYKTASDNDCIIAGPSGLGYTNMIYWNQPTAGEEALIKYAQRTDSYFRRTGFNIITTWDHLTERHAEVMSQNIPSLVGLTAQMALTGQNREWITDNRIPVMITSPRYDGDAPRVQSILEAEIDKWDGNSPAFVIPQLVSWESGVYQAMDIAEALREKYGDKVEFVRADHLMMLYNEYNNIAYNVALQHQNIEVSSATPENPVSNVVDGSFTNGWKSAEGGEQWIMLNFGKEYTFSRYVIENAGTTYYDKTYNTKDFKVQASTDGKTWTDIDAVKGNTSDIVDKNVDPFTASYVRILVKNGGEDGIVRIQEIELYGIEK